MSRRKRGAGRSPAAHTASPVETTRPESIRAASETIDGNAPAALPSAALPRSVLAALLLPILVAAAWWLALVAMAVFTANPITLNRDQILRADFVVTGTVDGDQPNTVDVDMEWIRQAKLQQVAVENLAETGARAGRRYVIPLSKDADGRYFVTRTKDDRLLIYPAEEEATQQLEAILRNRR